MWGITEENRQGQNGVMDIKVQTHALEDQEAESYPEHSNHIMRVQSQVSQVVKLLVVALNHISGVNTQLRVLGTIQIKNLDISR